jgi:hypothetical protein
MRTNIRQPFAMLLLCLSAACASAGGGEGGQPAPTLAQNVGFVEVTNDGHEDFVLYMISDGTRYRLGRVSRMETGNFRIPALAAGGDQISYQVALVAEPVGNAQPFATGLILWRPGQNLTGRVGRNTTTQNFMLAAN